MHQSFEGGAGDIAAGLVFSPPAADPATGRLSASLAPTRDGWDNSWHTVAKRAIDLTASVILLLIALPVLVLITVGVRITSPGPILFRQERVGRDGRHFSMLKFRTFPVEHDSRAALQDHTVPAPDSPIRFGRLLRRTSMDELPQLFNVLKGDMALVGPRPERPHYAADLQRTIPDYRERHRAPAGITGLAQVSGLCGPTSIADRVAADNLYIDSWTVWSDLRILVQTIPTVVRKFRW